MASSILDVEINTTQRTAESELQFQEFSVSNIGGAAELDVKSSHTLTFNNSPDTPGSDTEGPESELLGGGKDHSTSFWTFEYYQQFFDVDTNRVMERIVWSMIPRPGVSYLQHHIKPKPDLYGPFWICVTLVFTIAISGNLANYLQAAATRSYHWRYDFHAVTYAATAIFSYAWLVPAALWGILKWYGREEAKLSFLEILCVYGYSLSIYVPVSIFWVIQIAWLQWLLVAVGAALSGSVLLMTAWPAVAVDKRYIILAAILGLHLLLAAGFMLYFFHVPPVTDIHAPALLNKNLTSGTQ